MNSKIRLVTPFAIACVGALVAAVLALPATAGTNSWTAIGPDGTPAFGTYPFVVDPSSPSTIYSVVNDANGTITKTTDGGGQWVHLADSPALLYFDFLAIDPAFPATIYVGGGDPWDYGEDSIYKSIDGGAHWAVASNGLPSSEIQMLAIAPSLSSTLYAGEAAVGVFKSIDGGSSWTIINNGLIGLGVSALAVDPTDADAAYVAISDSDGVKNFSKIFKSTAGPDQWRQVPISIPAGSFISSFAIDPATPSIVYAAYDSDDDIGMGGVFKSIDSGETWIAAQNGLSDTNGVRALAIDPSAPARIFAATQDGVFMSTDAAASWTPINSGLPTPLFIWGISVDRTGSILRIPSYAGLFEYRFSTPLLSPGTVVEYQNTQDFRGSPGGHFFYTDDAGEQAMVDSGVDGHFVRTGKAFKAGGSKQVCRFYGSIVPGPNSHFYTISDQECELLKSLQKVPTPTDVQQWNYEGLSFAEEPAQIGATGPACTSGTIPIYRGYNNAYPAAGPKNPWDSAHRYSTSQADIQQMVTQFGWRDEGIAFCSTPP